VRVIWSPAALREVARATEYLMEYNPRATVQLAEGLLTAGDGLVDFPFRGRAVPNTGMRELVTDYPYILR
jgi:plasmid stabilization system protein ParE